jgi:uncharacterized membrane protein
MSIGELAGAAPASGGRMIDSAAGRLGAHRVILFRGAETHARSVLKAISWRTLGTLDTFAISWLLTGRVEIAGSIAGLEIVTKILWYYLHERVWAAIPWGRRYH